MPSGAAVRHAVRGGREAALGAPAIHNAGVAGSSPAQALVITHMSVVVCEGVFM
jgi:hypothetical protein